MYFVRAIVPQSPQRASCKYIVDIGYQLRRGKAILMSGNEGDTKQPITEIHLLLSGGGYRATLFHLGVLRYLFEHRLAEGQSKPALASVTNVVGVSGGSITAGHFVAHFERYTEGFDDAANDLLRLTSTVDLRREVLKKRRRAAEVVGESLLTRGNRCLFSDLPPSPRLTILGTDLVSGRCVSFSNDCVTVHRRAIGEGCVDKDKTLRDGSLLIADAVQASSAFPPFFPPLRLRQNTFRNEIQAERFSSECGDCDVADGGIRDNLGIDWYTRSVDPAQGVLVIVSDAGQAFDRMVTRDEPDTLGAWLRRLLRATDIQMMRLSQLDLSKTRAQLVHIRFEDRFDALPDTENGEAPVHQRVLPKGLAATIAVFPTDLIPVPAAFQYGLVRLGYDLSKKVGLSIPSEPVASSRTCFWREFWGKSAKAETSLADGDGSLKGAMDRVKPSQLRSARDALGHLPISGRMRLGVSLFVGIIGLLALAGTWSVLSFTWPHVSRFIWHDVPRRHSYSEFLKAVDSRPWEDVGERGAVYELRGQLYQRRENVVTIFLDRLGQKKLAEFHFQNQRDVTSLPTDAIPGYKKYLILEGTLSAIEPSTWRLTEGRLKSQLLDQRPTTWELDN